MRLFRAAFNGIGSAAGVAWPSFGIIFSVLGGSIGSMLPLTLGAFSIGLFVSIGISIFYLSYAEMKNNARQFEEQLKKNQNKLWADINNYVNSIYEHFLNQQDKHDFINYFKKMIDHDLQEIGRTDINSPLYQILLIIKKRNDEQQFIITTDKRIIFAEIAQQTSQKSIPYSKLIAPSLFGFVGTFGSIAGCSAGISGLLTGMGLFTSFTAFPLLGWGIIGVALICGAIMAYNATIEVQDELQNNELNQLTKKMHQQLSKAVLERNVDTALHHTTSALAVNPEKKKELFDQINKPILSVLHHKKINSNESGLHFISFFNSNKTSEYGKNSELETSVLTL
ncbi:hypothetical protein [Legionella maioricensis]|uniref:Uncharacterized protein n=1 Tax=Legionella maioricensis TaxID=2896528 RepID=A0A9X2D2R9_9GAMM|nr:hypothetical protein [Legionella maioricensis]MCL9684990.1 hypothetical protein [Legionella maioricensis]MCL9688113.1 hypothetical protein [Legionella maioricensis]